MKKDYTKKLTRDDIRRLKRFAAETPEASRRDFAPVAGMSYNTLLRCMAAKGLRFQITIRENAEQFATTAPERQS